MLILQFAISLSFLALSVSFLHTKSKIYRNGISTKSNRLKSTQLHMFDRFLRLVKSNINALLKTFEDPEKIIEQAISDMQDDLIRIRQSYAEVSATQKRMEKQKEQAEISANDWYRRAQLALEKGDEELAREALSRRQAQLDIFSNLDRQLTVQNSAIEKLYTSMMALENKITDARRQKETLIARARTAKTSLEVNDMLNNLKGSTSMDAFEKMKEKVESLESQAEIAGNMAGGGEFASVEEKFLALEGSSNIDLELQRMKRGLNKQIPQLPSSSVIDIDEDYAKLRKEFNRK